VDGEDDPRIYVSDAAAAARSSYGEILLTDELLGREPGDDGPDLDSLDLDGTEDGEPEDADDEDTAVSDTAVPHGPVGDSEILDDLGVSEKELRALDAEDALTAIAEALGASEVLETVR
jgi:putative tRNA adenosine deaminase-associated protein